MKKTHQPRTRPGSGPAPAATEPPSPPSRPVPLQATVAPEEVSGPQGDFEDRASQVLTRTDELFGKRARKFGPRLLTAAQALGFRFFKLTKEEQAQLVQAEHMYDGMLWDVAVAGYLSICDESLLFRAIRAPEVVASEILQWVEDQRLQPGHPSFDEAMAFFGQVIQDIVVSHAEPSGPKAVAGPQADRLEGE